jgi:RNA polymerase sigma factor (sigma-70 family)
MNTKRQTSGITFERRALDTGASFPFKARVMEYVVDLVNDPGASTSRLAAVIGWNPILFRSLSASANSAFGLPGRVRDVNLAVGLLGAQRVKDTVKWAVAGRATRHIANSFHMCESLWNHSLLCALVSRAVALETGYGDPNRALLAGLVHDIGFLFLGDDLPSPEVDTIREWNADGDNGPLAMDQQARLHEEAGSWMLDRWETLDPAIRDAVRHHHAPSGKEADPALAAIVHVADVICHRLFGGPPGSKPRTLFSANALLVLGLQQGGKGSKGEDPVVVLTERIMHRAPALEIKTRVLREDLVDTYEELEERERLVVALHYFEGMSLSRIAGIIGVTPEDVQVFHRQAVIRLAAMLAEFGEWS